MGVKTKWIKVQEICDELGISRKTFYEWRAKGRAPECHKLPNRDLRVRVTEYEAWLESLKEAAA